MSQWLSGWQAAAEVGIGVRNEYPNHRMTPAFEQLLDIDAVSTEAERKRHQLGERLAAEANAKEDQKQQQVPQTRGPTTVFRP